MVSYINQLFPFLESSDFVRTSDETVNVDTIYCPINFEFTSDAGGTVLEGQKKRFQAVRVLPCNTLLVNEPESVLYKIKNKDYGNEIDVSITEYDYSGMASRIDISDNEAFVHINEGYMKQYVVSDVFVNAASNGTTADEEFLKNIVVQKSDHIIDLRDWLNGQPEEEIMESTDLFNDMLNDAELGKDANVETEHTKDYVYKWLDSYFSLPEGVSATQGGREVVPLLIGPTGVFKSSTIKELCKKYDYRLIDFRVAFTSRLDYSGLFQMGEVEGKKYSYACPMEEIVTCSDGFREYCNKAYDRVSQILKDGYITKAKASDGENTEVAQEPLTDKQRTKLEGLLSKYKEYMKPVVLFFDEITRCFSGDTRVRLLDGRIRTMKELYEEFGEDKPFYVYACDNDGNVKFVPAYSRGITRKNAEMVKVTLDNGSEVICTPDHRWMLRDGSYEQAQYFEPGRSLMGTYFGTYKFNDGPFSSEYETFINPNNMKELFTHREVAKQYDQLGIYGTKDEDGNYFQAHHKDTNSRNNVPSNIEILTRLEHRKVHAVGIGNPNYMNKDNPEYVENRRMCMELAKKNPDFMKNQMKALEEVRSTSEYRNLRSDIMKSVIGDEEHRKAQSERCKEQWKSGQFNYDRTEPLKKTKFETSVRFVHMMELLGYKVTKDNYDNFVDRFTGSHGIYYSLMKSTTLHKIGTSIEEVIDEAHSRNWNEMFFHDYGDVILSRIEGRKFLDYEQHIADNPEDMQVILKDYSDVNISNSGVRTTLSYLNSLGDITEEDYENYYNDRDLDKYGKANRVIWIKNEFGSFDRAKEMSKLFNHKVIKVEWLEEKMDAYDIEVPSFHNFLIDLGDNSGVFVHNCKDLGVEGLLTEMLNQKRFNGMQMQGCKFVAATNLNLKSRTNMRHNDKMSELDEMYDVNTDIDVAYSNRFLPLRVQPEDVEDRWFAWAKGEKTVGNQTRNNIHPLILEFLQSPAGSSLVYNDTPVLDVLDQGLTENETKSQSYPNYRTWEMLSDYLYKVDKDYNLDVKEDPNAVHTYKRTIVDGLISKWGADRFLPFLEQKGYKNFESVKGEIEDEFTDFLSTSLDAGVPALMIGPSSMGKTTRVKSYIRKEKERTGLEPILINVDLSAKDVVDLMGMPAKTSIVDYVAGDLSDIPEVGRELSSIVEGVTKDSKYGLSDILTVRSPDKEMKDLLVKAKNEGREIVFMFDECNRVKNTSVLSAMFEVVSDMRFGGVDFSDMKDKVKVVAACNMAHSEMGDEDGDYSSAGAIDPALAARFSVFWKKHYDEKDVKSWITYMEGEKEEGKIDGTVLEYFKNLEPEKAISIISSVEKRQLAYAEPSTRNLHQLSMDIKSMRGKSESDDSKLFYGKLLFDDMTRGEFGDIYDAISSSTMSDIDVSNKVIKLIKELNDDRDVWDSQIANRKVTINNRELTATDLMDNLKKCEEELSKLIITPLDSNGNKRLKALNKLAVDLLRACNDLDDSTSQAREAIFETYVGEEFAREFTPYFNENFGSDNDIEITIEMLADKSLVKPFFKKYRSSRSGMLEEKYEESMLDLMREYLQVHGKSLQPDVYAAFIDGINASLASPDGMERILRKTDTSVDDLFVEAEKVGDNWILGMLSTTRITQTDIDSVRGKLNGSTKSSGGRKRKSVVL